MLETDSLSWGDATASYRDRQRGAILGTALELLMGHGSAGMSMAALASAAGISRATLYRYFSDLDAVLVGIAEMIAQHDEDLAAAVLSEPGARRQLREVVSALVSAHAGEALPVEAIAGALPPAARELLEAHERRTLHLIQDILERGRRSGELREDVDPEPDAALVIGMARSVSIDHLDRILRVIETSFYPINDEEEL